MLDGADAEGYEDNFDIVETEVESGGEDRGNSIVHPDFLLDNALYLEFNE